MTNQTVLPEQVAVKRGDPALTIPAEVLAAWSDLRGLAIPDEFVNAVGEALAEHAEDGFTARTRHLLGPLSVVLQRAHFDAPDHTPIQSFTIWRNVPRPKGLALGHIIGELLLLAGHTAVAVALLDSREMGVCFRFTSTEGDFIAREVVGLASGRAA